MKKKDILILLLIISLLSIASLYNAKDYLSSFKTYYLKQIIWYILGFVLIFIISKFNLDFIINKSLYLYLFGCLLLVMTLLLGVSANGARSWLKLGAISMQPSEFMKIFLILYLFKISLMKISDFKYFIFTLFVVLVPSILTFLEPDTGAVIFYLIIWFTFLITKHLNKIYYLTLFGVGGVFLFAFIYLYFAKQSMFIKFFGTSFFYRMDRLTNFNDNYQINMALTSLASCGLTGVKEIVYFPEAPTDFVFTLLVSSFGYLGLLLFLIVYSLLFKNILSLNKNKYLLYPVFFMLLSQYIINIFMNIGLLPIIGITLPFLSYGGSSLISYLILIGILLNDKTVMLEK